MVSGYKLHEHCQFLKWQESLVGKFAPINCGDKDLDDFFANDAILYDKEYLGRTYVWVTAEKPHRIVAAVTLANDSVKTALLTKPMRNRFTRPIDHHKRSRSYPAVLIGRLGVDRDFQGGHRNVGTQVIDFLKLWFSDEDNKTGCRFFVVDAYNNESVLRFYRQNGFKFLYQDENEEREFYGMNADEPLRTRMMFTDLK